MSHYNIENDKTGIVSVCVNANVISNWMFKLDINRIFLLFRIRALSTVKLEGKVTSFSESSQGEVEDNRETRGDFWKKLVLINPNIVLRPLLS